MHRLGPVRHRVRLFDEIRCLASRSTPLALYEILRARLQEARLSRGGLAMLTAADRSTTGLPRTREMRKIESAYWAYLPCRNQCDRIPSLKADKRKGFIYNRSLSVLTWSICLLIVSEVISAYLRIPITSTLAFGGIGGLAIGLAGKVRRIYVDSF